MKWRKGIRRKGVGEPCVNWKSGDWEILKLPDYRGYRLWNWAKTTKSRNWYRDCSTLEFAKKLAANGGKELDTSSPTPLYPDMPSATIF